MLSAAPMLVVPPTACSTVIVLGNLKIFASAKFWHEEAIPRFREIDSPRIASRNVPKG